MFVRTTPAKSVNLTVAVMLTAFATVGCASKDATWTQWGGPQRNFMTNSSALNTAWPEEGPKQLWSRELGDGYSTVLAEGDAIYTMYRKGETEFTIAMNATSGETLWEHPQPSATTPLMNQFGAGPHSTPLIVGDRLYSIGSNAVMYCFDKQTGDVIWRKDLPEELGAPVPGRGYGCSPIAYGDTVIVGAGYDRPDDDAQQAGEDSKDEVETKSQSIVALDQATGAVIWAAEDLPSTYASPVLINFHGYEQLVFLMAGGMSGLNPANGERLWHIVIEPSGANLATPYWDGNDLIFCSSAYNSGSRVIQLVRDGDKTVANELWYSRKMRIHHANAVQYGDYLYGSSGDFGPAFFMGLNINTGKVAWRKRGFSKATVVKAADKIILLDEDGNLAIATVTPDEIVVHSQCKIANRYAWAAPTLVGTKLYIRDREKIVAFDLG